MTIGPLINMAAVKKVEEHISDGISRGARIVAGGKRHAIGRSFYELTVIADATPDMLIFREETFGPVAPIFRFKTEEEAIRLANDTEFGLAAYFYGRDIGCMWRVAEALEYGMIGINEGLISTEIAPFGTPDESDQPGIFKWLARACWDPNQRIYLSAITDPKTGPVDPAVERQVALMMLG